MPLHPLPKEADVGVIVGRFQVPELHPGHRDLIDSVAERHQRVLVFLGSTPGVLVTRDNPLDFPSRRAMLHAAYPGIDVLPIPDQPHDEMWSEDLDRRIFEIADGSSVLLYGSRDGFCAHYRGAHPVVELAARKQVSGREIRKGLAKRVIESPAFRTGVIYAAHNRHPISYQTVDCAVLRDRGTSDVQVLLGRKRHDGQVWRFPGGFVMPSDVSLEAAASRELSEEAPGLAVHPPPRYIGSFRVDDWRYRGGEDGILTSLFAFDYAFGSTAAGDDLDEIAWAPVEALPVRMVREHEPLMEALIGYLKVGKQAPSPGSDLPKGGA